MIGLQYYVNCGLFFYSNMYSIPSIGLFPTHLLIYLTRVPQLLDMYYLLENLTFLSVIIQLISIDK